MSDETLVESFQHAGINVEIHLDIDPENPREWYNLGRMVCWHSQYSLGDGYTHSGKPNPGPSTADGTEFSSPDDFREWWNTNGKGGILIPLYLYDHSGITMSANPFACPWDSGQVGYIYVTAANIRKEYGKRITVKRRKLATDCLLQEVSTYDEYLTGQVYCYDVCEPDGDESGNLFDSCCGFYGLDYCRSQARESAEHLAKQIVKRESPENHLAESI